MKVKTLFFAALVIVLASSCSKKVYFNTQIHETLEVSDIPVTNLQFYNDKKIVLKRKLTSATTRIESGTVQLKDGEYIHFLILNKKTPGICKKTNDDELNIAFESGDGKFLKFKRIKGKDLSREYELILDGPNNSTTSPKVIYDGMEYFVHQGKDVRLMVERDDVSKVKVKKDRMKGVKIR